MIIYMYTIFSYMVCGYCTMVEITKIINVVSINKMFYRIKYIQISKTFYHLILISNSKPVPDGKQHTQILYSKTQ